VAGSRAVTSKPVRDGKFVLPIGRRMPLRDAAEAHVLRGERWHWEDPPASAGFTTLISSRRPQWTHYGQSGSYPVQKSGCGKSQLRYNLGPGRLAPWRPRFSGPDIEAGNGFLVHRSLQMRLFSASERTVSHFKTNQGCEQGKVNQQTAAAQMC